MDLSTTYMGLKLSNPLVVSASPLSQDISAIRQMEDVGAAAVVLWSLFEEQIEHDEDEADFYLQYGAERFSESLTYHPAPVEFQFPPEQYLSHIARAKAAVDMPIIASLNGVSVGGWISYARKMEEAGADALELNAYFIPADPRLTSARVEEVYLTILQAVKSTVSIPVAMKLSPFFSSTANMTARLIQAGADGLVLFNRFYQPDLDLEEMDVKPSLNLSRASDMRLPLRWIAILYGNVNASLAATGGIYTAQDVAKMIMAGADVTMMCSALLENGLGHVSVVRAGLVEFMQQKQYESLSQMKGVLSQRNCSDPSAFERANYMKALQSFGPTATLE